MKRGHRCFWIRRDDVARVMEALLAGMEGQENHEKEQEELPLLRFSVGPSCWVCRWRDQDGRVCEETRPVPHYHGGGGSCGGRRRPLGPAEYLAAKEAALADSRAQLERAGVSLPSAVLVEDA